VAGLMIAASISAAPLQADPVQPYVNRDGTVAIVGNDGLEEVIRQLNALFTRQYPAVRFSLRMEGSSAGMPALTAGATAFAPLTRDMWPGDQAAFRQVYGYDATPVRIGYNGHGPRPPAKTPPAVYVHRDNPLAGLTMAQVGQVLTSGAAAGDIQLWSQLGLKDGWAPRRIHVYGLRDDGGFATGLRHARFKKRPYTASYEALATREAVIQAVAADRYGIAVLGWVNASATSDQVRVLPLAGKAGAPYYGPDKAYVRAGLYPLSMPVQLYVNRAPGKPLDPLVKAYLQLALSPQGQAIINAQQDSEEGYLPLSEQDLQMEQQKLNGL
jgi:phosphate transport system substrate-binding protein